MRRLTHLEATSLVDFMRLALLCNCTWRFVNFNIDHREHKSCQDAYKELQARIIILEDEKICTEINALGASFRSKDTSARRSASSTEVAIAMVMVAVLGVIIVQGYLRR
uniref:Uncharacterized protein n=1 Tax=Octactis speculum TaxID=3111310 RepID=A0A7S2GZ39_9STRA